MNYLFRGICEKDNQWRYGYFIESSEEHHYGKKPLIVLGDDPSKYAGRSFVVVKKGTVGMFSGFLDKKQNKIFEGDIVSMQHGIYKYSVHFENGSFVCYHLEAKDLVNGGKLRWGLLSRSFELGEDYELKVIGNIYEK